MNPGSFKNVINKMFANHIYRTYMYKQGLALINIQGLIFHKNKSNQTKPINYNNTFQNIRSC